MSELDVYKEILIKLGLSENEEAIRIYLHCLRLYPEFSEEDIERMLGMLSLVFELDYNELVHKIISTRKSTRKMSFVTSLPSKTYQLFSFIKNKLFKNG